MSGSRPSVGILVAALAFGAAAFVSLSELIGEFRSAPLLAATRLERTARSDVAATDAVVTAMAREAVESGACPPRTALRAAGSLLAEQLDVANPAEDYEAWAASVLDVEAFYKLALACAPAQSLNWARLGLVDVLATQNLQAADRKMEIAGWLSPAYYPDLAQRIAYWSYRAARAPTSPGGVMKRDLAMMLRHAQPGDIGGLLRTATTAFMLDVELELLSLPPERREELEPVFPKVVESAPAT